MPARIERKGPQIRTTATLEQELSTIRAVVIL